MKKNIDNQQNLSKAFKENNVPLWNTNTTLM